MSLKYSKKIILDFLQFPTYIFSFDDEEFNWEFICYNFVRGFGVFNTYFFVRIEKNRYRMKTLLRNGFNYQKRIKSFYRIGVMLLSLLLCYFLINLFYNYLKKTLKSDSYKGYRVKKTVERMYSYKYILYYY